MANYSIALGVQPPIVDVAKPFAMAAEMERNKIAGHNAQLQGQAMEMQLGEVRDRKTALDTYSKSGEINSLSAHPEIQNQILGVRAKLKDEERAAFDERVMRNARRAQRVMGAQGEDRTRAWREELGSAREAGDLSPELYERYSQMPPNDLLLNNIVQQAMPITEAVKLQTAEKERAAGLAASQALGGMMGGARPGVPAPRQDYFSALKAKESSGDPLARSKTSSATGLYQFTEGTWNDLAKRYPDLGLNDIEDPDQQERAVRTLTAENIDALIGEDIAPTDKNLRVAHFLGATGASKFVRALDTSPGAKAIDHVSPEAAKANRSVFYHPDGRARTVKGVYSQLTKGLDEAGSAVAGLMPAETGTMVGGMDTGKLVPALAQIAAMPGIPKETQTVALELMKNALGQNKPTPDMTEYEFYRRQSESAGETPLPFAEFQQTQKKAGATNIQVAGGDIGLGKKAQGELQTSLIQGQEQIARLNNIRSSFKPEYQTLPFKAGTKLTQIKSWLGRDLSEGERESLGEFSAYKRQALSNISLAIKELTGAAMSLPEAERIKGTQPDAGDGMFDGDDPVTFKSKLDDTMKSTMRAVARQHYVLTKGIPGKPWEVMGLDEVDDLINQRGNALLEELKAANSGANEADLHNEVRMKLRQEFGIGFEGAQ